MMYFKALFSNRLSIFFSAVDPDAAIEYGNKEAEKRKVKMIGIYVLSDQDAKAQGLID